MKKLFFVFVLFTLELSAEVTVSSEVVQTDNGNLRGLLIITHPEPLSVDAESARIEGKVLELSFLQQEAIDTELGRVQVSAYQFQPSEQKPGLHLLPSISIQVGREMYASIPHSYVVVRIPPNKPLHLEAEVVAERPIYPGQRIKLVYRIFYQGSIDLKEQSLPFLEPKSFLKVGSVVIQDTTWEGFNVQEISQEVQVTDPGLYPFEKAFLEDSQQLRAEIPPQTIEVIPFPEEAKPAMFQGALGEFVMRVSLLSSNTIQVGDLMELQVDVLGDKALHTVNPPNLLCQPGFSGFFSVERVPTVQPIEGGKRFLMNIRSNTSLLGFVPPIEFASFSRRVGYLAIQSEAIPITLKEQAVIIPSLAEEIEGLLEGEKVDWKALFTKSGEGLSISTPKVKSLWLVQRFGTWWMVCFTLVFCGLILLGKQCMVQKNKEDKNKQLRAFIQSSFRTIKKNPNESALLLSQFLRQIKKHFPNSEQLPKFQRELSEIRFSEKSSASLNTLIQKVEEWLK